MEDLDKKLNKILRDWWDSEDKPDSDQLARNTIKQAFADAGWLDTNQLGGLRSTTIMTPDGFKEFMVGREWYDRFQRAYNDIHAGGEPIVASEDALEAAKRASGIDE